MNPNIFKHFTDFYRVVPHPVQYGFVPMLYLPYHIISYHDIDSDVFCQCHHKFSCFQMGSCWYITATQNCEFLQRTCEAVVLEGNVFQGGSWKTGVCQDDSWKMRSVRVVLEVHGSIGVVFGPRSSRVVLQGWGSVRVVLYFVVWKWGRTLKQFLFLFMY